MTIHRWVATPPEPAVERALHRLARAPDVVQIAVMPDVHLAHDVCIGTVLATTRLLYPAAIGGDVGCGVATLRCRGRADALGRPGVADAVHEALRSEVPIHRHRSPRALPAELRDDPLSLPPGPELRDARVQLGTLGRGNHFLELQSDPQGSLWIMVHTGSRAIGPAIQRAHGARGLASIDAGTPEGAAYLHDLSWAVRYAEHSRQAILAATARIVHRILGYAPDPESYVECAHNLVCAEEHGGRRLWVHRKGAIGAAEGQRGLIPGSMGDPSFHVVGRGCAAALCSSSHGAGRRMSRTQARRTISVARLRRQLAGVSVPERLLPSLIEEAPGAYRDIGAVMRAQRELTRIVREVTPLLSHKGG